jgi:hypothetical protein
MKTLTTFINTSCNSPLRGAGGLGGNAVYQARQMLFIDVLDAEMTMRSMQINNNEERSFSIYPNPNNGLMQLNYFISEKENGTLEIFNVLGEKLTTYQLANNSNIITINEANLSSGIYFYKVLINDRLQKSDKFVISK